MNIIECPVCGLREQATMDIQQVCQGCGTVLRPQVDEISGNYQSKKGRY